jgi:SP family general alpha glucoside:H+ symporter-like MFS transporter
MGSQKQLHADEAPVDTTLLDLIQSARDGTEQEHRLSLRDAIRIYKRAICWSMLFSLALVMEGYDTTLLQSFFAFPGFVQKYGSVLPNGKFELSAPWQAGLSNGAYVGEIIGLFISGAISETIGYRKTMIGTLSALTTFIFIPFFAPDLPTLLAGEILCGVPWGIFQTLTIAYAAEVCPVTLQGYLTTFVNLCWVIGQLLATGVLRSFINRTDQWSYRIPFALQWMWIPLILTAAFLGPESPWWLIRQNRTEDARRVLYRLAGMKPGDEKNELDLDKTIAMMVYTSEMEKKALSEQTRYLDCFRRTDLRRTEIACVTWAIQALCGSSFMGYSAYFYQRAGLDASQSFNMSLGQYSMGIIGTLCSWLLMTRYGRRSLYLRGLFGLLIILFSVGFASLSNTPETSWAIGSLLLVFTFVYDSTIGPVCYSIVAEIPSTQLRAKTIVIARNVYNIAMIMNGFIVPYMLNQSAWNWKGKTGFFWGGITLLLVVWTYFRLPECKGRTFGEIDILFEKKVGAREFENVEVEIGAEKEIDQCVI